MVKRKWAAADLAGRVTTAGQAKRRIEELYSLISGNEAKIESLKIRILKYRKEQNLLKSKFQQEK